MSDNYFNARVSHMHDIEENWNKCPNFIPTVGEIIVYDADVNYTYQRIKIGDGVTSVINLPFLISSAIDDIFGNSSATVRCIDGGRITEYQN